MLLLTEKAHGENLLVQNLSVSLTFDQRQKSRIKTNTMCGLDVGIILSRGEQLFDGDVLTNEAGDVVRIIAESEEVVRVVADSALALTRAAYHLGNRHVPIQIDAGALYFKPDHVLEEMINGLGLKTERLDCAFQPESGAYHGQHSHHHHAH